MRVDNISQGAISTQDALGTASQGNRSKEASSTTTQVINETSKKTEEKREVEDLKQELSQVTKQLNKEMNPLNTNIEFGFSDDIEELYVTVFEKDSQKVIRKIPSEEAMQLMAKMREIVGIIFDKKG